MSDETLTPAQRLRRRFAPDPVRELVEDFRAELAAADPAERQALFDTAADLAGTVAPNGAVHDELTQQLHVIAFPSLHPSEATVMGEAWREMAAERDPRLTEVFEAIDGAESDAEKAEIVAAALSTEAFDHDDDAVMALLASDPTIDARLDATNAAAQAEDSDQRAARGRAEVDAEWAAADAEATDADARPLRAHIDRVMAGEPVGEET